MKQDEETKNPVVDFTHLSAGGKAEVGPLGFGAEVSHVKMASGEWNEIVPGSFRLYKSDKGVPFIEFKVSGVFNNGVKTIQVFPAHIAGWAFD